MGEATNCGESLVVEGSICAPIKVALMRLVEEESNKVGAASAGWLWRGRREPSSAPFFALPHWLPRMRWR